MSLPRHRVRQYLSRRGVRSFAQSGPTADRRERRRAHPEIASIKVNANGQLELKANGELTAQASGPVKVAGAIIQLN